MVALNSRCLLLRSGVSCPVSSSASKVENRVGVIGLLSPCMSWVNVDGSKACRLLILCSKIAWMSLQLKSSKSADSRGHPRMARTRSDGERVERREGRFVVSSCRKR